MSSFIVFVGGVFEEFGCNSRTLNGFVENMLFSRGMSQFAIGIIATNAFICCLYRLWVQLAKTDRHARHSSLSLAAVRQVDAEHMVAAVYAQLQQATVMTACL